MNKALPNIETLCSILAVDATAPSGLRWRTDRNNRIKKDTAAGYLNSRGRWCVQVNGSTYFCHRIVYFMQTGVDPLDLDVDHINRNPSDNTNIRLANRSQNSANKEKNREGKSSIYKGVSKEKNRNKWRASIRVNYKLKYLGSFNTEWEAAVCYNNAALAAWGEYAVLNELAESEAATKLEQQSS